MERESMRMESGVCGRFCAGSACFTDVLGPLFDSAGIGLWQWNLFCNQLYYNRSFLQLCGYENGELAHPALSRMTLVHTLDLARMEKKISFCLAGICAGYREIFRLRSKNGDVFAVVEAAGVTERDEAGTPRIFTAMVYRVRRRAHVSAQLRKILEEAGGLCEKHPGFFCGEQEGAAAVKNVG